MYIIDKNKDFYDHYSHIYGVDKSIVFDRRGSTILTDDILLSAYTKDMYYRTHKLEKEYLPGEPYFYLLEVGYKQFLIKYYDVKLKYVKVEFGADQARITNFKVELVHTFADNKSLFNKPISLIHATAPYRNTNWSWCDTKKEKNKKIVYTWDNVKYDKDDLIPLPIIKDTSLTKVLDAETIWKEISTWISSQKNDRNVDIINSDVDKIINHGFDKKTSFRNPIKL